MSIFKNYPYFEKHPIFIDTDVSIINNLWFPLVYHSQSYPNSIE
jgi:hypothetical protein